MQPLTIDCLSSHAHGLAKHQLGGAYGHTGADSSVQERGGLTLEGCPINTLLQHQEVRSLLPLLRAWAWACMRLGLYASWLVWTCKQCGSAS